MKEAGDLLRIAKELLTEAIRWRDYGAWVLPKGKILPVQSEYSHSDVAKSFFLEEDGSFNNSPYLEASIRGWVRVAYRPDLNIHLPTHITSAQRSILEDMISEYHKESFVIDKDVKSLSFDDRERAIRFMRSASHG
jgi:hypothetical protein